MKTLLNSALFLILFVVVSSCDKTVEVGPNNATLNTDDLVKAIAKRLDGKCIGYQLIITRNTSCFISCLGSYIRFSRFFWQCNGFTKDNSGYVISNGI